MVLAVVGAARVAAEGISAQVEIDTIAAVGNCSRVGSDFDLDPGVLRPEGGELADRPADGLGAAARGQLVRSRRQGQRRALIACVDIGKAEHRADQARLVVGNAVAVGADALPGAKAVGAHSRAHGGCVLGAGVPLVPIEGPGIAALRAGHARSKAPRRVAAAVGVVHDRSGLSIGATLGAPGHQLAGVPLVARHHDVA